MPAADFIRPRMPIAPPMRRTQRQRAKARFISGARRKFARWWQAPVSDWFFHRYGVLEGGNVSNDPHGEFTGRNILYQANELEDTALHFDRPVERSAPRSPR
jgi:hypothetical protein